MGTITERPRKDGTKGYCARILIKRKGRIVFREAETFDRKQVNGRLPRHQDERSHPNRQRAFLSADRTAQSSKCDCGAPAKPN